MVSPSTTHIATPVDSFDKRKAGICPPPVRNVLHEFSLGLLGLGKAECPRKPLPLPRRRAFHISACPRRKLYIDHVQNFPRSLLR